MSKNTLPFSSAPASICILRLSAIGDCTHVVPVVRTIQRHWPDTQVTWIIGKAEASLMQGIDGVEFIVFDKKQGSKANKELAQALKGRSFDILLNMQIALRASIASRAIKAPIRLGYDKSRAKDYQWLFTNHKIPAVDQQHVLDSFFEFTKAMGLNEQVLEWNIPIPEDARAFVDQHVDADRKLLTINPCTSNRSRNWRNWSAENYAAIAQYAIEHYNMQVVLTGGNNDIEIEMAQAIEQHCPQPIINLVGQSTLKQLLAILDRADVMISPDTGPAHMATTVNTPVIGLYATSNPNRTGPYLSLEHTINCYPENLQKEYGKGVDEVKWGKRVRDPEAMLSITTDAVKQKLDQLMSAL